MRPLIIDDTVQAKVAAVVKYAEAHPFTMHEILRLMEHPEDAPGNTEGFVTVIPFGFRCVFTHEQQPPGWCRHLSVSVMEKDRGPNEMAMRAIMRLFGFKQDLDELIKAGLVCVMEESVVSVNVLETLK